MQKITPFLWFDGNAEEAANFYVGVFKNSRISSVSRYGEEMSMPAGTVLTVDFELDGQPFIALNGGPAYKINEAVSFLTRCETQAEIDYLWEKLTEGGKAIQCGWLTDKFGVTWQIVPANFEELMLGDSEESARAMRAMMGMVKLDIAALQAARDQRS